MSVAPLQKTHPGRLATPFDTKKDPEQRLLDKETCVEKFLVMGWSGIQNSGFGL